MNEEKACLRSLLPYAPVMEFVFWGREALFAYLPAQLAPERRTRGKVEDFSGGTANGEYRVQTSLACVDAITPRVTWTRPKMEGSPQSWTKEKPLPVPSGYR